MWSCEGREVTVYSHSHSETSHVWCFAKRNLCAIWRNAALITFCQTQIIWCFAKHDLCGVLGFARWVGQLLVKHREITSLLRFKLWMHICLEEKTLFVPLAPTAIPDTIT